MTLDIVRLWLLFLLLLLLASATTKQVATISSCRTSTVTRLLIALLTDVNELLTAGRPLFNALCIRLRARACGVKVHRCHHWCHRGRIQEPLSLHSMTRYIPSVMNTLPLCLQPLLSTGRGWQRDSWHDTTVGGADYWMTIMFCNCWWYSFSDENPTDTRSTPWLLRFVTASGIHSAMKIPLTLRTVWMFFQWEIFTHTHG